MIGRASGYAAVSIVNALPLGVGAAVGIDWPARASASVRPGAAGPVRLSILPPASRTAIVRHSARAAVARFGTGETGRLRLSVRSTIPVARGLKSSSAVSTSVALATARAFGREPSPEEVARLAADAGRSAGVSATGAFDDALAGLTVGGVVTDNRRNVPLRRLGIGRGMAVALWIPTTRHPPSPQVRARFRRQGTLAHRAVDAALDGDWIRAMEANSALVERAMGYRYDALHAAARDAGATAAGVSGLGPTFAALAPAPRIGRVLRSLPTAKGRRRCVPLVGSASPPEPEGR